jgi:hypothetical protein
MRDRWAFAHATAAYIGAAKVRAACDSGCAMTVRRWLAMAAGSVWSGSTESENVISSAPSSMIYRVSVATVGARSSVRRDDALCRERRDGSRSAGHDPTHRTIEERIVSLHRSKRKLADSILADRAGRRSNAPIEWRRAGGAVSVGLPGSSPFASS